MFLDVDALLFFLPFFLLVQHLFLFHRLIIFALMRGRMATSAVVFICLIHLGIHDIGVLPNLVVGMFAIIILRKNPIWICVVVALDCEPGSIFKSIISITWGARLPHVGERICAFIAVAIHVFKLNFCEF